MTPVENICDHTNYDSQRLLKFCRVFGVRTKGRKIDERALEDAILEHEDSPLLFPTNYTRAGHYGRVTVRRYTGGRGYENF